MRGTEQDFAEILTACASGLSVQESIQAVSGLAVGELGEGKLTPEQVVRLTDLCEAASDVAAEYIEQGLDPDDLDPSWPRMRRWILGAGL